MLKKQKKANKKRVAATKKGTARKRAERSTSLEGRVPRTDELIDKKIEDEEKKKQRAKKRRRAKRKFNLFFFLLLSGTVFYFGWIQLKIPPSHVGILFTKTSGYEPDIYNAGEFLWRWEALIPGNMSLYAVPDSSFVYRNEVSGVLPSGEFYQKTVDEEPLFSYNILYEVAFKLRHKELLQLLIEGKSEVPDFPIDSFYKKIEFSMAKIITESIRRDNLLSAEQSSVNESVLDLLSQDIPEIEIISLKINPAKMPDYSLYEVAKEASILYFEQQSQQEIDMAALQRDYDYYLQNRIDALESYGRLFQTYPELLTYFSYDVESSSNISIGTMLREIESSINLEGQ